MWDIKRKTDRGSILAALVVAAFDGKQQKDKVEIEDLSRMLAKLIEENVLDLNDFSISPGGEYSEDVARFVSNLLFSGYAKMRSPLVVHPSGMTRCRTKVFEAYIDKEKSPEISLIARTLGIDLDKVKHKLEA